jgi:hypothetical protein
VGLWTSQEDWLAAAKTAYHQQTEGLTFNSHAAWKRLQNKVKWQSNPRKKILGDALPIPIPSLDSIAPDNDVSDPTATGIYTPTTGSASCLTCPIGQKAAKKCPINSSKANNVFSTATELASIANDCLTSANQGNNICRHCQKSWLGWLHPSFYQMRPSNSKPGARHRVNR